MKINAFTLIEMVIVVAIIGILVGIAVPALSEAGYDNRKSKAAIRISTIEQAKARYLIDNPNTIGQTARLEQFSKYIQKEGAPVTQDDIIAEIGPVRVCYGNYGGPAATIEILTYQNRYDHPETVFVVAKPRRLTKEEAANVEEKTKEAVVTAAPNPTPTKIDTSKLPFPEIISQDSKQ